MALFPVPSNEELMSPDGWDKLDKRTYAITRYHFGYREVQAERKTFLGEILNAYRTPAEIHTVAEEGVEVTVREQTVEEVGRQLIQGEGILAELSLSLNPSLGVGVARVETNHQARIQKEVIEQLTVHETTTSISAVKRQVKLKKKTAIPGGTVHQTFVSVQAYKRKRVQLWLRFIDYLTIEIKGRRRYKHPVLKDNQHRNRVKLNVPVAEFIYYESLDHLNGGIILSESEYQQADNVLNDPTEVLVSPPTFECQPTRLPSFRSYKTLYQLADIAFPPGGKRK